MSDKQIKLRAFNAPVRDTDTQEFIDHLTVFEEGIGNASIAQLEAVLDVVRRPTLKRFVHDFIAQTHNQPELQDQVRDLLANLASHCRLQSRGRSHDQQWVSGSAVALAAGLGIASIAAVTGGVALLALPPLAGGLGIGAIGYFGSNRLEQQSALYSELAVQFEALLEAASHA
ncbi:MAG: hypothetical protein ACXIVL_09890 [Oceanicaulis sp.]